MSKRPLVVAVGLSALIVAAFVLGVAFLGKKAEEPLFGDKLGVVEIKGFIGDSTRAVEALDEFTREKRIRAVVLRVDSPGGGLGATQEIYKEVKRTAAAKPVVCSMGSVAASGGLYVAVACSKIVANPGTITGSIGVISTIPNLQGLFEKLGIKLETVKSGALKGAGQPDRPLTDAERAMMQNLSKDLYNQFITSVAQGRNIPEDTVRALADGGVFSGRRALELGFVDELGNFQDAVRLAARLGGIKGRPSLVRPEDKHDSWLGRILKDEAKSALGDFMAELDLAGGPQYLYLPSANGQ